MQYNILWADDEIDLLKPHIMFLTNKGYNVTPVNSGSDALDKVETERFDIVFLDEMMPGMTGLETLAQIKQIHPSLPVVMITKSEEEHIMEDAIGSKIADYLIKPLNPNQILLSVKKILDNKRLVTEKTTLSYQQQFRNLAMQYQDRINHEEWAEIYKKLIYWELELETSQDQGMAEVFSMQKSDANANFAKFIEEEYEDWLNDPRADRPLLSHQLMKQKVFPHLKGSGESLFFLLIDNFRFDQWKMIQPILQEYFNIEEESTYYSILPTTTGYSRNAIFAGMMPSEIERKFPQWWVSDENTAEGEEGLNKHEHELLQKQLEWNRLPVKFSYNKILNTNQGKSLVDNFSNLLGNSLNVVVYNFVDMLSHARTDVQMIKELAPDEAAYRSITKSWFQHSPLLDLIRKIAEKKCRLILTTDHGMIRVQKPVKIIGYRETNTNLRYKHGKNLGFDDDHLLVCRKPERFFLPKPHVSTSYVFTKEDYFFAYPNNYNQYVNLYRDTFQHGGISMEEVIIPFIDLKAK
ncbi:T9SS response regulator signal transducer PorX [Arundinibacter roseus]|uniref:PglZ domain-containing protein n=1 Tax=Arundinibacter roseus TaxID=2070510 RepID=A0A4V2X8T9_9BACT|nr:PglZ domain-containing protein [Arundinibacter roseus]TDB61155.1 PglZ domain-containing protein [Arundinibacter roseus]